jgi:hypothetical protein
MRIRGEGNGSIFIRDGSYVGRWYSYGNGSKVRRPEKVLGKVKEITMEQARERLAVLIAANTGKSLSLKGKVIDWTQLNAMPSAGDKSYRAGAIAEAVATADMLIRGYEVFKAVCPTATCDLIAIKAGITFRVEVKYISETGSVPSKMHRALTRNIGKFDLLAVVQPNYEVKYFDHDAAMKLMEVGWVLGGLEPSDSETESAVSQ